MKNVLFNIKSVITGSSKAVAGAGSGAETFWKSEPEREKIVSAPQPCLKIMEGLTNLKPLRVQAFRPIYYVCGPNSHTFLVTVSLYAPFLSFPFTYGSPIGSTTAAALCYQTYP
jgi:hypothetical protein